jgi:hypothetical protein
VARPGDKRINTALVMFVAGSHHIGLTMPHGAP